MEYLDWERIEQIQGIIVKALTQNPAGFRLYLIGGFRYRFLDNSCRYSRDIDYYWKGDLVEKQEQIREFLERHIIPEVTRLTGYEGSAHLAAGPDSESTMVKTVDLAFWPGTGKGRRIEIPVNIMYFDCVDNTTVKTAQGVIVPTSSDRDMAEGKVVALLNRWPLQERDFIDLYLFGNNLVKNSGHSIRHKLEKHLTLKAIKEKLRDIRSASNMHINALDELIQSQMEPAAAANLKEACGGAFVFKQAMSIVKSLNLTASLKAK